VLVWKQLSGGIFEVYELVPGFIASALAVGVASLVTSPPPPEVVRRHHLVASDQQA